MKPTFEYRDPAKLKNHLLSIELYGESLDDEFMESVRKAGKILEPLRILGKGSAYPEGTVISGRRRRMAAMTLKMPEVPVIVEHELKDRLDIDEQVILSNRPNQKTVEQRGREFVKLREIEAERASIRQKQAPIRSQADKNGKNTEKHPLGHVCPNGEEPNEEPLGRASDIAAEAVGLSRHTAEKAAEVIAKIDQLEDRGQTRKAEELRESLEKSVSGAHKVIAPKKKEEPEDTMKSSNESIERFARKLKSALDDDRPTTAWIDRNKWGIMESELDALLSTLRASKGYKDCPKCDGKKCKSCRNTGYMPRVIHDSTSPNK